MKEGGNNVEQYKPHSMRATVSSAANFRGVPIQNIMEAAGWAQESTFRRFYNKPVNKGSKFQTAVLQKWCGYLFVGYMYILNTYLVHFNWQLYMYEYIGENTGFYNRKQWVSGPDEYIKFPLETIWYWKYVL